MVTVQIPEGTTEQDSIESDLKTFERWLQVTGRGSALSGPEMAILRTYLIYKVRGLERQLQSGSTR